jgi:hypothetical protein
MTTPTSGECHKGDILLNDLVEVHIAQHNDCTSLTLLDNILPLFLRNWSSFACFNVSLEIFNCAWTSISVDILSILEPEESWEALDFEASTDGTVNCTIDFSNIHSLIMFDRIAEIIPNWGKLFAIATPDEEKLINGIGY